MSHPFDNFMKRFFTHYLPVQRGLSVNTVMAYRDTVKLLICYTSDSLKKPVDRLVVEDIGDSLVLDFLEHIEKDRGCSPRTRNARLAAIRSLFAFIAREAPELLTQCRQVRAIPLKRTEHKTVEYLEEEEMQALLNTIDINSRTGVRDRALLLLLYNTGARVSEIVSLEIEHMKLTGSPQVTLMGKGKKERACPIWPETVSALEEYLKHRSPKAYDDQRVFLNANGDPITRFGIRHITRKYGDLSQRKLKSPACKRVNPHTIRHTTAMHLIRAGNDMNMVSYWLGHADINTTHIYIEIDMEMKRKMIEKAKAPNIDAAKSWQKPKILQWLKDMLKEPQLCGVKL